MKKYEEEDKKEIVRISEAIHVNQRKKKQVKLSYANIFSSLKNLDNF